MSTLLSRLSVLLAFILALTVQVAAQSYPDRVVRIVVPYPAGGSVDLTARILAQKLSDHIGQQFIVEHRTGAGGNTGADSVAKSPPDGHTLLHTAPPPLVINQTLYSKGLPFDPVKDFAPIAIFAYTPIVLMVHPSVPAKDVKELIAPAAIPARFTSAPLASAPSRRDPPADRAWTAPCRDKAHG